MNPRACLSEKACNCSVSGGCVPWQFWWMAEIQCSDYSMLWFGMFKQKRSPLFCAQMGIYRDIMKRSSNSDTKFSWFSIYQQIIGIWNNTVNNTHTYTKKSSSVNPIKYLQISVEKKYETLLKAIKEKINQLRYIPCSWSKVTILLRCQFILNWSKDPVQFQ